MTLRFTKADRHGVTPVDSHFTADDPRVLVKPDELPAPLYPEDEGFWQEFDQVVVEVGLAKDRAGRSRGVAPCITAAGHRTADKQAELVHRDRIAEVMTLAAADIAAPMTELAPLGGVFTDKAILLDVLLSMAGWMVSPSSFCAKNHFKVPRPEEVAGAIVRGEISAPHKTMMLMRDAVSWDQVEADERTFTMYPEGSPMHGSYNAMHSAAAGAQAALLNFLFEVDADDRGQVHNWAWNRPDLCAWNMAFFRTTAGVHYPQDNLAGLWLGQETLALWLPDFLGNLGVDRDAVLDRIVATRVDWLK